MAFDKRDCSCGAACDGHNHRTLRPNERCSCGSGKKFKRCCGGRVDFSAKPAPEPREDPKPIPRSALMLACMAVLMSEGMK